MTVSREIVFIAPRISIIRHLLPVLLLLAGGGWLTGRRLLGGRVVCLAIGAAGMLLSGIAFIPFLRRLHRRPYSLALKESGLYDDASDAALGLIAWSDITRLQQGRINHREYLTVFVREPEKYLDRLSPVRQKLARTYYHHTGSPVNIPVAGLGVSTVEIMQAIEAFLNRPLLRPELPV